MSMYSDMESSKLLSFIIIKTINTTIPTHNVGVV